ncbi:MAG: hypothetical protein A2017_00735 [Lentisphaerae bacterium GWF2_44_16]|nr:MAG: hypothetical protein A2017_00735 [Lentisphaerae bacterium GWF2_44_16]
MGPIITFSRYRFLLLPLIFFQFICGCSILPPVEYRPVSYFDIGEAKPICPQNISVDVYPFINNSPAGLKMLYRYGKYKISMDDDNKWSLSPETMLTRYLTSAFAGHLEENKKSTSYILTGSINSFEFDMDKMETCFSVEYQIKTQEPQKTILKNFCTFHQKFNDTAPSALVAAMLQTVSLFTDRIKSDLENLKQDK